MALTLIQINPPTIINIFPDGTTQFKLPTNDLVEGAYIGWTGEGYALVQANNFIPTNGQEIIPQTNLFDIQYFSIDQNLNVTTNYPTQAIPPAPITTIQIVSTSTPALNGTYPLALEQNLGEVAEYVMAKSAFPDGLSSMPVPDVTGAIHVFSSASQFMAFVEAMADLQTALDTGQAISAQPQTIP